ncbi:hypothetical protein DOY81_006264 [Sarcophaga bullata]|nr:hypothetical protein DOY81_006264 [Sarcophaga bullata]
MKSFPLNISSILVVILLILFVLFIHHHLLTKVAPLRDHAYSTKTQNVTTDYSSVFTKFSTLNITARFENRNSTSSARIKRFLIFDGGGVVKLVIGTSFPITLADKKRSLSYFYNFQMQYVPPPIPLFWWSLYNTSTFPARKHTQKRSTTTELQYDSSRVMLYKFIEAFLQDSGVFDGECLLRIICEMSSAPLVEDFLLPEYNDQEIFHHNNIADHIVEDNGRNIYHALVNLIFIPPFYSNIDERYLTARNAGRNGANCSQTYGECKIVEQFFKQFVSYI